MITTIIFDFDGTLADTLPESGRILESLSAKYGFKYVSKSQREKMRDFTIEEIFKKSHVPFYQLPFMVRDIKRELHKKIDELQIVNGIPQILEELKKRKLQLAIISSNNKNTIQAFLEKNNVDFFSYIYTGTNIFGKARVIQGFLNKYDISAKDAVYIGDEIRDVQAVKKMGIPIIAVSWGFNSRKGLQRFHPDALIDAPKEIIPTIQKLFI